MNIKKIILAFAASAMLAGGCTSLDMDPVSDITDLNYWKTPEQFDSFVFGLHSRFRSHSWNMFLLGEARSDVFGGIPFGGEATQGMERFPYNTLNAENPGISGFGDLYQNINQMNLFISRTLHTDVLTVHGEMSCLRKSLAWVLKWVNWQRRRLRLPKSLSR